MAVRENVEGLNGTAPSDSTEAVNGTSSVLRPEGLVPFSEHRALRIYQRNLPHWRQEGCTYFVTFRLADSIPVGVKRQWEYEQSVWLRARGINYDGPRGRWRFDLEQLPMQDRFHFEKHFNQQVQTCLDRGLGACWLGREDCALTLRDEILRADGEVHHVGGFVIMPNHVHLLTTPHPGHGLEIILKKIKGKAAIECNQRIGRSGSLWQPESYDHIVRDVEELRFYRQYIADNPGRAGIELFDAALYRAEWMDAWLL